MPRLAYCSNVHAGMNLSETRANLEQYACRVQSQAFPGSVMGLGLWLPSNVARQLKDDPAEIARLREFLVLNKLDTFTFNGFPYGNFHQEVVKKDVYLPTWYDPKRLDYTLDLVSLILQLSDAPELSISTLPIGWGDVPKGYLAEAGRLLGDLAVRLHEIEQETGRLVHVCIEPEPGCAIQYSTDLVSYLERYVIRRDNQSMVRRHLRACHDICHAVVMCESQEEVLSRYESAGVLVGKVQISSAVTINFDAIESADKMHAVEQLATFAEDRYLHQTTIQNKDGDTQFFIDLPLALQTIKTPEKASGKWRIHFHIPVYLSEFGYLKASQEEIIDCLRACKAHSQVNHFEVETYAWNVLPTELMQEDLANGIAQEMTWFQEQVDAHL